MCEKAPLVKFSKVASQYCKFLSLSVVPVISFYISHLAERACHHYEHLQDISGQQQAEVPAGEPQHVPELWSPRSAAGSIQQSGRHHRLSCLGQSKPLICGFISCLSAVQLRCSIAKLSRTRNSS